MKNSANFFPNLVPGKEVLRFPKARLPCESCNGRGWVYLRTFEICSDCEGRGGWRIDKDIIIHQAPQLNYK